MITFIRIVAILAIIYLIAAKIINRERARYKEEGRLPAPTWGIVLAVVAFIVSCFVVAIPAQECGVVITPGGVKKESYKTGWHIVMPWYNVKTMDKTIQVYTCAKLGSGENVADDDIRMTKAKKNSVQGTTIWAPTIDGIKMGFDISASWKIDEEHAWWIYDNVSEQDDGTNGRFLWLEENVIKAKLKSALSLTASKYTPIEVYSNKREEIQEQTLAKMRNDIKEYHLLLEQIDIREVYYNPEYEQSINQKKLEEQKALTLVEVTKQKEELDRQAEIDKRIAITNAEAEAEALRIKGQSVASNPRIVELEWINKWNGQLPEYWMGGNQSVMLGLNK